MAGNESIRGYRITYEKKPQRELSMDYLMQSHEAAEAQRKLWLAAAEEGAPCVTNPEPYIGDDLPTDREAAKLCATCPVFDLCRDFAEKAHPAWGVHAGKVYGRKLDAAMKEADEA